MKSLYKQTKQRLNRSKKDTTTSKNQKMNIKTFISKIGRV